MSISSRGGIRILSCWVDNKNNLFVHLTISSESKLGLEYDVIFKFIKLKYLNGEKIIDGVLKDKTELKVFSNSPEFVFTYANAFNKKDLLIDEFKSFLGSKALNETSKVKNPNSDIGMPTSLFCCLKHLENIGFFGNYNYVKFINNMKTKPKSFSYILSKTKKG